METSKSNVPIKKLDFISSMPKNMTVPFSKFKSISTYVSNSEDLVIKHNCTSVNFGIRESWKHTLNLKWNLSDSKDGLTQTSQNVRSML